jgi:hypothetical protein
LAAVLSRSVSNNRGMAVIGVFSSREQARPQRHPLTG